MKAWFNEKHNWCIELDSDEMEMARLAVLVSEGAQNFKNIHNEKPKDDVHMRAYLSAKFLNYLFRVILIGQNYTQSQPTIDNPMSYSLKNAVINAIENMNNEYTADEVEFIKAQRDKRDLL